MVQDRTQRAFVEELPHLLEAREMSVRSLEKALGLSHGFISRVLRQRDYKTPSPDLTRRVARALKLPEDFFPEAREGFISDRVRRDPTLRERLYNELSRQGRR